jgi:hypothetical protein
MRFVFVAAALLWCGAAPGAVAQPAPPQAQSPEAIAKVYACAAIADAAARLACFDAAVGAMKAAEAGGEFAAVDAAGVRQIEREAFGFSLPSLPRLALPTLRRSEAAGAAEPERTAEMAMTIARIGRFDGRPSFVMSNGQTWVLIDTQSNRLARPGATVTVKRAALGSYLMSVEAGGAALRVRRAE